MFLIVKKPDNATVQEVSEAFDLSYNHLNKVNQKLVKIGAVKSTRGKGGGIQITEEGENLTLDQIVKLLENYEEVASCVGTNHAADCKLASNCFLRAIFKLALEDFYKRLRQYRIKDLVKTDQMSLYQELLKIQKEV